MSKARKDYAYVAHRLGPNPQNLGDYSIGRRDKDGLTLYHYNSANGRLINRGAWLMPHINKGSRIYQECVKAVERLNAEESL